MLLISAALHLLSRGFLSLLYITSGFWFFWDTSSTLILTENKLSWFSHRICCYVSVVWQINGLYVPAVFHFMRTVPTAQYVEKVTRHMPRGCWHRHPEISRPMFNITSYIHVVRLFIKQPLLFRRVWYEDMPRRRKLYQVCNVRFYCEEQGSWSQYSHTGNFTTFLQLHYFLYSFVRPISLFRFLFLRSVSPLFCSSYTSCLYPLWPSLSLFQSCLPESRSNSEPGASIALSPVYFVVASFVVLIVFCHAAFSFCTNAFPIL